MKSHTPTILTPHNGQPAAPLRQSGGVAAVRARQLLNRRVRLVKAYLDLIKRGVSPVEAALELRYTPPLLQRMAERYRRWGKRALHLHFSPPRPAPRPAPVPLPKFATKVLRRCPRRGVDRFEHRSNVRLLNFGRYLQLRSQGLSRPAAARKMGASPSNLWSLEQMFREGGLAALRVYPPPGRPSKLPPLRVPESVIQRVQRLAVAHGARRAWSIFLARPDCPHALARALASAKSVPDALLRAVRVPVAFVGNSGPVVINGHQHAD